MAIQKKSLISNKAVTTKSTSKVSPATPKLQTALMTASAATRAVTAIKLGKAAAGMVTAIKLGS